MFIETVTNPCGRIVGDCAVRALGILTGQDWETTYTELCYQGFLMCDMPNSNQVIGAYLRARGYYRYALPEDVTIGQFVREHRDGKYAVCTGVHIAAVIDGDLYDAWNSSHEVATYYYAKEK